MFGIFLFLSRRSRRGPSSFAGRTTKGPTLADLDESCLLFQFVRKLGNVHETSKLAQIHRFVARGTFPVPHAMFLHFLARTMELATSLAFSPRVADGAVVGSAWHTPDSLGQVELETLFTRAIKLTTAMTTGEMDSAFLQARLDVIVTVVLFVAATMDPSTFRATVIASVTAGFEAPSTKVVGPEKAQ